MGIPCVVHSLCPALWNAALWFLQPCSDSSAFTSLCLPILEGMEGQKQEHTREHGLVPTRPGCPPPPAPYITPRPCAGGAGQCVELSRARLHLRAQLPCPGNGPPACSWVSSHAVCLPEFLKTFVPALLLQGIWDRDLEEAPSWHDPTTSGPQSALGSILLLNAGSAAHHLCVMDSSGTRYTTSLAAGE